MEDSHFKEEFKLEIPEGRKRRRKKKRQSKPVFKEYNQNQIKLLPPSLEEMIPEKHLVRVVNDTVDKMDITSLIETYKGGGSSAFHPLMLIKVLLYAYSMKIYSCRSIEKELRENINFMWLSGNNQPDFRTINTFRSGRLKDVVENLFGSMLILLVEGKYIDLKKYFVDGTKLQADANKNSYVWKSNTNRYKEGVQKKVAELFKQIDEINCAEDKEYGNKNFEELGEQSELTSSQLEEAVEKLNEVIKGQKEQTSKERNRNNSKKKKSDKDNNNNDSNDNNDKPNDSNDNNISKMKELSRIVKQIGKAVPKLSKYEAQEKILGKRNSYSKTDQDATFFKMKNGELLPGYNVIIGTENQIIVNYTIHQKASESDQFISHMTQYYQYHNKYPELSVGDATYGNEENYKFLEDNNIENYLKYNTFHYETTKAYKENKFQRENFKYDEEADNYECPNGRKMIFKEEKQQNTLTGFEQTVRIYESESCKGCQFRKQCKKKGGGKKKINVNRNNERLRAQARVKLTSEEGISLRKQRNIDVEPCFGDLKFNQGYKRFRLRGKEKVNIEFGLLSMSHNIRKIALKMT